MVIGNLMHFIFINLLSPFGWTGILYSAWRERSGKNSRWRKPFLTTPKTQTSNFRTWRGTTQTI